MPVTYRVLLDIVEPDRVEPRHLRALVTSWLEADHDVSRHRANTKPFAVTPLHVIGDHLAIDIRLLDDDLERSLIAVARRRGSDATVRLGSSPAKLVDDGVQEIDRLSWSDLHEDALCDERIAIELLTPTVFRSGKHEQHPFPSPGVTFGHYRSRWNHFAPERLRCELDFAALGLRVVGFSGRSGTFTDRHRRGESYKEVVFVGFVGRIDYTTTAPRITDEHRRWLHRLASLADFCGTGANTTIGMGVTRYLGAQETSSPHSSLW